MKIKGSAILAGFLWSFVLSFCVAIMFDWVTLNITKGTILFVIFVAAVLAGAMAGASKDDKKPEGK